MISIDIPKIVPIAKGRRKFEPEAVNLPSSFDIETSSFYELKNGRAVSIDEFYSIDDKRLTRGAVKRGCLCAWGFGFNGKVTFGRTWGEFITLMVQISEQLNLDPKKRILPVYVHNLSYEFQWIRKYFGWESVFAVSERQPIRALTSLGIEFRDSLILSGMSLEKTAESLVRHKIDKLVGSWDYSLLRGSETEISPIEWKYLENDNLIVMDYISELLDEYKSVNRIPMTKTGFVREDVRDYCFWGDNKSHKRDQGHRYANYSLLMRNLVFTCLEERDTAKLAFAGGFTHSNSANTGIVLFDILSMDITSSYPAVMCSERFPMSKGKRVEVQSVEEFERYCRDYCCLIDIAFKDIESTFLYDHIISRSKCVSITGEKVDNGRVISATYLRICITEVDYECFKRFYKWANIKVFAMWIYIRGYLPKPIIEKTIEYYEGKTTLKGIEGKEAEYARLKTLVNSLFGMCVYDPLKPEIVYDGDEWKTDSANMEELLEKYNNSKSRFLSYLWGIWITAYARRNIFSAILETKEDHVYTDTDSEKFAHPEKHMKFFNWYNKLITRKIRQCLLANGIDPERANPKDVHGVAHPLGVFDFDGRYARFKTLGAKRYAVDYGEDYPENKRYSLTISGVNKYTAVPSLLKIAKEKGKDFFDLFAFGMIYDRKTCGKLLHTYIDDETEGEFIDKDGKINHYKEKSFVHLEETTYEMTASDDYFSLLNEFNSITYIA